jgi:gas vesicle protein
VEKKAMRRLVFFVAGLLFGAALGASLAFLVTPTSGRNARKHLSAHVARAQSAARQAAEAKRRELEAQLDAYTRRKKA